MDRGSSVADSRMCDEARLPSMFRCGYWLVYLGLAIVTLALVVWGFAGRIGEHVYGAGLIMGRGTYAGIQATGDGILVALDVKPGDEVALGQIVGCIYSPEDYAALRSARALKAQYEKAYETNRSHVASMRVSRQDYSKEELARLDASLERQRKQIAWYEGYVKNFPKLAKAGAVSQFEATDAQTHLDDRYLKIDTDKAERLREVYNCLDRLFSLDHDLFDYEVAVHRARATVMELENLAFVHGRIISRCAGRVVNVNVDVGDVVKNGQELVRVSSDPTADGEVWTADVYFPAIDATELVPGMPALVTPSTVDVEREGSIRGFIASVGEALETQESLERAFRSASFSRAIDKMCRSQPVRVTVVLTRDPATPSGFAWTSGTGPEIPIPHGTLATVSVRTRTHSPMSILLGRARRVAFGDGIMERDRLRKHITQEGAPK